MLRGRLHASLVDQDQRAHHDPAPSDRIEVRSMARLALAATRAHAAARPEQPERRTLGRACGPPCTPDQQRASRYPRVAGKVGGAARCSCRKQSRAARRCRPACSIDETVPRHTYSGSAGVDTHAARSLCGSAQPPRGTGVQRCRSTRRPTVRRWTCDCCSRVCRLTCGLWPGCELKDMRYDDEPV